MWQVVCTKCKHPYPDSGVPYLCSDCGGIFDFDSFPKFSTDLIQPFSGIWGYFGDGGRDHRITLGEGNTPLIWDVVKSKAGVSTPVGFKCEFLNPTGSFKDRGSAALVTFMRARGITNIVEDSSGNAGASIAAYGARAGMNVSIYVPSDASGAKKKQMERYGANVVEIKGSRSQVADALITRLENQIPKSAYASHAYLPFNLLGYATVAIELILQMGTQPGTIVLPVGQGGLLYGVFLGFRELMRTGRISSLPMIVGVQASACAPLYTLSKYGTIDSVDTKAGITMAEGIRIEKPLRAKAILDAMKTSRGFFCTVEEKEIEQGMNELARRGLFVEPTSAIVYHALQKHIEQMIPPVVAILTGTGYKSLEKYERPNTNS